jgi:hypothetical protein
MSKRYLRQLRAEMACVERLQVARHQARGRFGYRCWPERGGKARRAFIDGLVRAEHKAGMPVYGILLPSTPDGWQRGDPEPDSSELELELVTVWRARDGMSLGEGTWERVVDLIEADLGLVMAMRMRGLEPPRGFPHTDLNRARLPIPPHPRLAGRRTV